MSRPSHPGGERGIALLGALLAIFLLALTVGGLVGATMAESTLAFDQMRGQQALGLAEAGALRALAELRRRLHAELDQHVRTLPPGDRTVGDICSGLNGRTPIEIITEYARPPDAPFDLDAPGWTREAGTAVLSLGSPAAWIRVTDRPTGRLLGMFYAVIAVRASGSPPACRFADGMLTTGVMWFDFALFSAGRAGNATRGVCLRSAHADRCPMWFPRVDRAWRGSADRGGGAPAGWPVLIVRDGASYAAPRNPAASEVFAPGDPLYALPRWEEVAAP